jgi:prepilin-type N-terminal cleavage/methylation domain-containing protein
MKFTERQAGFSLVEILMVVAIFAIVSAIAVPQMGKLFGFYKLSGDARSVSNAIAVAKMRAAADFTRVRIYVDIPGNTFKMQIWDKTLNSGTGGWTTPAGSALVNLSANVKFGFDVVAKNPANNTIVWADTCKNDDGTDIANTACVVFNSRGVPVDVSLAPTSNDALYLTDVPSTAVYGVTIAATGMIRSYQTPTASTPHWVLN